MCPCRLESTTQDAHAQAEAQATSARAAKKEAADVGMALAAAKREAAAAEKALAKAQAALDAQDAERNQVCVATTIIYNLTASWMLEWQKHSDFVTCIIHHIQVQIHTGQLQTQR